MDRVIYGKDETTHVVSVEITDNEALLIIKDGRVVRRPAEFWILFDKQHSTKFTRLQGGQAYQWAMFYDNRKQYNEVLKDKCQKERLDHYVVRDEKSAYMVRSGVTYYKGMRPEDLTVLSFDIETTGTVKDDTSKVLIISNTLRKNGKQTRKTFRFDEHDDVIQAWCEWVVEVDPDVLTGHNIFGFDLPYLAHCAGGKLKIGRDGSALKFSDRDLEFRKDGSQTYTYRDAYVFGREIVDTFFLAIKGDIGRKYDSYGLKAIIQAEGLEAKGRQHYDASKIKDNYLDPVEFEKIVAYAEADADDPLKILDLYLPAYFYFTQSCPMSLQQIINRASGAQINSIMVRAYLQDGQSIPKASPAEQYEGAISFGNPGVYKHVYKVDVASLYPSIIRQFKVADKVKDPNGYFLHMVEYFTDERLKNKALAKQTGERHYKDLEQAQKLVINSAYGFMGAQRVNFNSPENAAFVTRKGREILQSAISWAEAAGFKIVNADTDSISYTSGKKLTDVEVGAHLDALNATVPELIRWEDDGYYKVVVVVKAKNYVLDDGKKVTIKGSALKATYKEPALKQFIAEVLEVLKRERYDRLFSIYERYARMIDAVTDIAPWCSKKTVTKAVLNPGRTNEARVLAAAGDVKEGDKIHVFFKTPTELCLREGFDGTYCKETLFGKLHDSLSIFETLIDVRLFPNYALKRNKDLLF